MSVEENVTIKDALVNVSILDDLPIIDDQPSIEALSLTLDCRANFDTNFEDRNAFITGCSKYIEEATRHGEFNEMLREGFQHAANLYTWRCCSRAVPMVKSNDQANRTEINESVAKVLEPEVRKLYAFMFFTNNAIARFCDEVKRLCHPEKRKDFVSEAYLLILGKFLNMFAVLDELKNMKASIKNDFSTYRRAAQFLQNVSSDIHQMHNLSLFLATQNKIKESLRTELQKIESYEELLADVVRICEQFFENEMYISSEERHMYVKVIAFCLYLMDAETSNVAKLDQKKRITIQKLDKIFKSIEVVPLFGDMQIQPFSFVRRSPFYDASKWPLSNVEGEHCHINIVQKLRIIRDHHDEYVTHLARIKNEISVYDKEGPRSDAENREIANLTLNGLRLLCSWTCDVMETEYERATKYNYSPAEKSAIIEVISMIKDVQALIGKMEAEFSVAIRRHIYAELQDFVQLTIKEPLGKAMKSKKDFLTGIMNSIIDTCCDNSAAVDQLSKYGSRSSDLSVKSTKKSKKAESTSMTDIRSAMKRRGVAPSNTQLYMVRTMLESLISEKSSNGNRIWRKDIDKKHLDKMRAFLQASRFWPALLHLSTSLEQCADLCQLWFREFYLEMTMGKRIQFPIDMSIPWILIDHVLSTQDPALMECILLLFDLYNDAANFALKRFRKQFLYDEVEAEVNLCFDQFIYKFSESVFTHFKQLAACMLLDKGFKADCTRMGITIRTPPAARFEVLLKQRHLQLLGRSIDLNRLITQRINVAIQRSLDVAISKFESEGIYYILTLDNLLETNRLCHRLLSEHLGALGDFKDFFVEANHQVSSPYGRITLHIYSELNSDLIPNYCFNTTTRRFVRAKINYRKPPDREKAPIVAYPYEFGSKSLNAAFSNISAMYSGFVGLPHLRVINKILGYQGIATILDELLCMAKKVIDEPLKAHARMLFGLAPKTCKLPLYSYGTEGVLQYYVHHNKEFFGYAPLKKEFCQSLRELGNIIVFCLQLELALAQEEMLDLLSAAAFTNTIPKPPANNIEEQEIKMKRLENKYSRIQIASIVQQLGNEKQCQIAKEAELLTKERLCCGLNIFEMVLSRLRTCLFSDSIWRGDAPPNGVMWIDECVEFHRLWSGFQFVMCYLQAQNTASSSGNQQADNNMGIEEIFGDGVYWAGCTMIRLLGQYRRFEVLDYCYHSMRVHRAEPRSVTSVPTSSGKDSHGLQVTNVPVTQLLDRIRRIQAGNNQIFAILGNYMQQMEEQEEESQIQHFTPPVYQQNNPQMRANILGSDYK
ncbi:cytoplasmic fragile-X interacting family domain-containing protein [Ditylenchus destructor]|uniref:Cytoplasmic FMR1-interacting protein n=1 Tax=Ditylenchus destructor TaxID=166010 RepID=A0AAD4N4V4_9BILA|nr:cytoplasmic fragile-X interacting family domain-containing protein [Ditylenchus destructor]